MRVHTVTSREGSVYVARCLGADVAAQGATADEAEANVVEAFTLSRIAVATGVEPPRLGGFDAAGPGDAPAAEREIDGAALIRELEESGWTLEERGVHAVLTKAGRVVVVPLAARIAPGVYRVIRARLAEVLAEEAEERRAVFARLDAIFAANPWEGDVTQIIREQRDSR